MTFQEALQKLGIEDYAERIMNSNSRGELFHLMQYTTMAEHYLGKPEDFRKFFEHVVKEAEVKWKRPASIYQHIEEILIEQLSAR